MELGQRPIESIPATFRKLASERGSKVAMRHKDLGLWQEISWSEYYQQSVYVAHALIDADVQVGDFVGIIGENSPEWLFMDMGIQMAGAVTVGIYTTNAWPQVQYVLDHANCKILFAENEEQVEKWLRMKQSLPNLSKVIYWDKKGLEQLREPHLQYFNDFSAVGEKSFLANPERHSTRVEQIGPDDTAILVYTSGTTGQPKGAMLTHRNLLWVAHALNDDSDRLMNEQDETISFLPLCHIFERMFSVYLPLVVGSTINFAENSDTIFQNLPEIKPTLGHGVPRVWEKLQSSIILRMHDAPFLNRWAFEKAMAIGHRYTRSKIDQKPMSQILAVGYFLAYWVVFFPLKYNLGLSKMRYALSGAAPISPKVLEFYHTLGITMMEGYGMTETSCIITVSRASDYRLGTVGKVIEGGQIRLGSEGEILVRHPGVIKGYYKNRAATQDAIVDGWLHTGDIGEIDAEGYLKIVDRKKDLIITAGGKNIAPQSLENKLKCSPYINDAIVIGDRRKFLSAIIVLDEQNINQYARAEKIQYTTYSELANHQAIMKLIDIEVKAVNKEVARVQSIRKFTILDKRLYVEDGEVTPTMKVKRKFINEQYGDLISAMYTE